MASTHALQSLRLSIPCAEVMKLLADDTRLKVVELLLERPRNVQSLNDVIGIDPTLLSHHLRTLREAALIVGERAGRHITYRLSPQVRDAARDGELDFGCCRLSFGRRRNRRGFAQ